MTILSTVNTVNTTNDVQSNRPARRWSSIMAISLAGALTMQPAQAGTEEAIVGLLAGAMLISAAHDSRADYRYREVHYSDVHHRQRYAYHRDSRRYGERHYKPSHNGHHRYHGKACGHHRHDSYYGSSKSYHGNKHWKQDKHDRKHWKQDKRARKHERRHERERYAHEDGRHAGDRHRAVRNF